MRNTEKGFLAFIAGVATGATLGILFAPRSGEETRHLIAEKSEEYKKQMEGQVNDMVQSGKKEIKKAKKKAMDKVEEATKNFREAGEAATDEVKGRVEKVTKKA